MRTTCLIAGAFVRRDHAPSFAGKALAYTPGRRCFSLSFRAGFPSVVAREQIMLVLCTSFGLLRFARSLGVSAFLPLIYLLFASELAGFCNYQLELLLFLPSIQLSVFGTG